MVCLVELLGDCLLGREEASQRGSFGCILLQGLYFAVFCSKIMFLLYFSMFLLFCI